MNAASIRCCDARELGRSLRIWRALRRIKQEHAGHLLGVSQATVSRWECGAFMPDEAEQAALRQLMAARLDSASDFELARLVTHSTRPVHLICDLTHRLLALSPARARQCRVPSAELLGRSLWPYATQRIAQAEEALASLQWFGPAPPAVELSTDAALAQDVMIPAGRCRWVRFQLSTGTFARLVETLPDAPRRRQAASNASTHAGN